MTIKLRFRPRYFRSRWHIFSLFMSFLLAVTLSSCNTLIVDEYEATALTTITWQINYKNSPAADKRGRFEEFASVSLLNRNGEKPQGGVVQDDKELWWPKDPPKPSLDEIEKRQKTSETPGKPERLRTVKYEITYQQDGN